MKRKKLFSLKAFSILTGLLFFVCLTTGSASASYVTSLDFGDGGDWVQENATSGTDFASGVVKLTGDVPPSTIVVNHTAGTIAPVTTTITYGTVITDIAGTGDKCWITQNLGASQQATSATDTADASAGWYWQFNREQGYAVGPTPAWTITGIDENSHWTAANDPSTELGPGWRLPTSTEWANAASNGAWANYNDTYNSVLKLHTAGALYKSDGTLNGRGNTGHYWSSTQSDSVRGYLLRFNNSSRNVFGDGKTDAFSVRCLRDIVPYPTSQAYYVTTAAGSQIDSSLWDTIQSVTTDETTPAGTSLKYLASFDGRQSWKYWTGSAWADSSFGDFQTNGMSKTALEAINGSQWSSAGGFTEGTVDFAIDLNTTDPASTPELTGISFNYLRDTYDRIDTGIGSWGMGYSESQKEQLYWLYKNGKAGLDPADLFLTHDPETGDPLPQGGWKWSYTSDPLEGHEVGNAWQDGDTYYIKLGSGLIGEPLGGGVPEIPVGAMPFLGTILSVALKRFKRRLLK